VKELSPEFWNTFRLFSSLTFQLFEEIKKWLIPLLSQIRPSLEGKELEKFDQFFSASDENLQKLAVHMTFESFSILNKFFTSENASKLLTSGQGVQDLEQIKGLFCYMFQILIELTSSYQEIFTEVLKDWIPEQWLKVLQSEITEKSKDLSHHIFQFMLSSEAMKGGE
jgi:hypothetical protein